GIPAGSSKLVPVCGSAGVFATSIPYLLLFNLQNLGKIVYYPFHLCNDGLHAVPVIRPVRFRSGQGSGLIQVVFLLQVVQYPYPAVAAENTEGLQLFEFSYGVIHPAPCNNGASLL